MLTKNILFYTVAATVIALIAQVAGASLPVVLFSSLLGPPGYSTDNQNYPLLVGIRENNEAMGRLNGVGMV